MKKILALLLITPLLLSCSTGTKFDDQPYDDVEVDPIYECFESYAELNDYELSDDPSDMIEYCYEIYGD
jgi:hypothetical protein